MGKRVFYMNNNCFLRFIVPFFLATSHFCSADPIISFFLRSYPDPQMALKHLKHPSKLARYQNPFDDDSQPFSGIFSTYAGMIGISDVHGETIFPRKNAENLLYLVVTTEIIPVAMFHNTIHHWELNPKIPTTIYYFERKTDKESGLTFWDVQPGALPNHDIIPLESIVLIAKPNNVYIPTGITPTIDSPHLLLPDIYIKKGINVVTNASYILSINNLFHTIKMRYDKKTKSYSFQIS